MYYVVVLTNINYRGEVTNMVCEAVIELRKMFGENKKQILEKMKAGSHGEYLVVDFDIQTGVVYISNPMKIDEYKTFMNENWSNMREFEFYMVIYGGANHTYQQLNRKFAEHLYEYISNDIGAFIPDGTTDFYLNAHVGYTTAQLNKMCDEF